MLSKYEQFESDLKQLLIKYQYELYGNDNGYIFVYDLKGDVKENFMDCTEEE